MRQLIKNFINKQQFQPGFFGLFVNPFFIARKNLLKAVKSYGQMIQGKTLDIGCGTKPYEIFFNSSEYIGLEIETQTNLQQKNADYYYDGKTFPFENSSFDSAVCNQVLEHVFTPNEFIKEINRILKIDGTLLLTVPFVWDEHEQPFDYARYSSFGLTYLLSENGFEIIEIKKLTPNAEIFFQLINAYLYKITYKIPMIKQLTTLCIMSLMSLIGIILGKIFPSNPDLYLDNCVLAKKVRDV